MSKTCTRQVAGGKGNYGMFIDRQPNICAAGRPSPLNEPNISALLSLSSLQDEVDAMIHDSIIPPPPKPATPPLRREPLPDLRNAGSNTEGRFLINPPVKTKFETLVEDFKETVYTSYWKKSVGKIPDPASNLPEGAEIYNRTFGHKPPRRESLYDVITPKNPDPKQIPKYEPGKRSTNRNYCQPSFNPDAVFGIRHKVDIRGCLVKRCLTDDRVPMGTHLKKPINAQQFEFLEKTQAKLGVPLIPINNIADVPQGHVFGVNTTANTIHVSDCMTHCELNPQRKFLDESLAHLNTLRKCLSKRFDALFFKNLYLSLKRIDKCKTGWLPKKLVYDYCAARFIHIDTNLLERLLSLWNIFNGSEIEYKSFVNVINFTQAQVSPTMPKTWDVPDACIDNRTTYSDMTRPGQEVVTGLRAVAPSGRYFEKDAVFRPEQYYRADQASLSHETDARVCLNPSMFSILGITHRDMFAVREHSTIRKVFEASGEKFTEDSFDMVWEMAEKYHSQGLVCYETFRRALREFKGEREQ